MDFEVMKKIVVSAARIQRVLGTGLSFVLGAISTSALWIKFFEVKTSRKR